jgi:hypothetical protein
VGFSSIGGGLFSNKFMGKADLGNEFSISLLHLQYTVSLRHGIYQFNFDRPMKHKQFNPKNGLQKSSVYFPKVHGDPNCDALQ